MTIGRAFERRPGLTASRAAILVLVAAVLALAAGAFAAPAMRADAPAHWRPFLLKSVADVRPAPPPAAGSQADRGDLDEIVALQAKPAEQWTAAIGYWTAEPSPTRWNEILLSLVRTEKISPVRTSRAIALLNTAIYERSWPRATRSSLTGAGHLPSATRVSGVRGPSTTSRRTRRSTRRLRRPPGPC